VGSGQVRRRYATIIKEDAIKRELFGQERMGGGEGTEKKKRRSLKDRKG